MNTTGEYDEASLVGAVACCEVSGRMDAEAMASAFARMAQCIDAIPSDATAVLLTNGLDPDGTVHTFETLMMCDDALGMYRPGCDFGVPDVPSATEVGRRGDEAGEEGEEAGEAGEEAGEAGEEVGEAGEEAGEGGEEAGEGGEEAGEAGEEAGEAGEEAGEGGEEAGGDGEEGGGEGEKETETSEEGGIERGGKEEVAEESGGEDGMNKGRPKAGEEAHAGTESEKKSEDGVAIETGAVIADGSDVSSHGDAGEDAGSVAEPPDPADIPAPSPWFGHRDPPEWLRDAERSLERSLEHSREPSTTAVATRVIDSEGHTVLSVAGLVPPSQLRHLAAQRASVLSTEGTRLVVAKARGGYRVGKHIVDVASYNQGCYTATVAAAPPDPIRRIPEQHRRARLLYERR